MIATATPWGAYVITSGDAEAVTLGACRAGARIVQYRDKHAPLRRQLAVGRRLRGLTREAGALLVVNDRVDLAQLCEADAVHLGQQDCPVAEARRLLGDRMLVGVSTHSLEQARRAEEQGADYIGIGPVFGTPTKPEYPPIGIDLVRQVLETVKIPAVVIGGVDLDNLGAVRAIGARTVAMVRALATDTEQRVRKVNAALLG